MQRPDVMLKILSNKMPFNEKNDGSRKVSFETLICSSN
jgi:hypothetical protein